MKQDINLYLKEFHPVVDVLPPGRMAWIVLVFLGILLAMTVVKNWQLFLEKRDVESLQKQLNVHQEEYAVLRQKFPEKAQAEQLTKDVAALETEVSRQREVLSGLIQDDRKTGQGFSPFLEGLSRQVLTGLWFEKIEILDQGKKLTFTGKTIQPELVFEFVQRLRRETAFQGLTFNTFSLEQTDTKERPLQFLLSTDAPKKSEEGAAQTQEQPTGSP